MAADPVKVSAASRGSPVSASDSSAPDPVTRLSTPGGTPASTRISASSTADPEAAVAGFQTTGLPQARAGASFQAGIASGKFQGVSAQTTPTGSAIVSTIVSSAALG